MSDNQALDTFDGLNYEEIEKAVMETSRGRWFLAEFARRHKAADTSALLDAIKRLEGQIQTMSAETASSSVRQQLDGLEGLAEIDESTIEGKDKSTGEPEMSGKLDRTAKLVRSLRSSHKLISKSAEKPMRLPSPLSSTKSGSSALENPPDYGDADEDIFADETTEAAQASVAAKNAAAPSQTEATLPVDSDTLNFAEIELPDAEAVSSDDGTPGAASDARPDIQTGNDTDPSSPEDAEIQGAHDAKASDDQDTDPVATSEPVPGNQQPDGLSEPASDEPTSTAASDAQETSAKSKKRIIVVRRPADDPGEIPLAGSGDGFTGSDTPAA